MSYTRTGKRRFFFKILSDDDDSKDVCSYDQGLFDQRILKFNGQAVKVNAVCTRFSNSNKMYISTTPASDRGHDYVVNLFKRSRNDVNIEIDGETVPMSATGFTATWNNHSAEVM